MTELTDLLASVRRSIVEEPHEPAHRAALHDLLVDAGHTCPRLLSACLTGEWIGTLDQWMREGPLAVRLVVIREDGVRLKGVKPYHHNAGCSMYYGRSWSPSGAYTFDADDLPSEFVNDPEIGWCNYDTVFDAMLAASRLAHAWAVRTEVEG